jgi:hypothetical protein
MTGTLVLPDTTVGMIEQSRGARAAFLLPPAARRRNSPSGLIRLVRLGA